MQLKESSEHQQKAAGAQTSGQKGWPPASQRGGERMDRWHLKSFTRQWLHGNVPAGEQGSAAQRQTLALGDYRQTLV